MTHQDVLDLLRRRIAKRESMSAWAAEHGIAKSYLSQVLAGHTTPGPSVLDALGLKKVVTYQRLRGAANE